MYKYKVLEEELGFIRNGGNNMEPLLVMAIEELKNLKSGEIFLLKDLFKGYEWKRIKVNDRLHLGTSFIHAVASEELGVEIIEKTSSHQQKYRKS
jgi:hypothetical protein